MSMHGKREHACRFCLLSAEYWYKPEEPKLWMPEQWPEQQIGDTVNGCYLRCSAFSVGSKVPYHHQAKEPYLNLV